MRQLSHLPPQIVQLSQLSVKIELLFVAVRFGLILVARVNTGHRSTPFDIRNPNGGDLLEPQSEANILDSLSIDLFDIEAQQLLLRLVVPGHTGEVPSSINHAVAVQGQGAAAIL